MSSPATVPRRFHKNPLIRRQRLSAEPGPSAAYAVAAASHIRRSSELSATHRACWWEQRWSMAGDAVVARALCDVTGPGHSGRLERVTRIELALRLTLQGTLEWTGDGRAAAGGGHAGQRPCCLLARASYTSVSPRSIGESSSSARPA